MWVEEGIVETDASKVGSRFCDARGLVAATSATMLACAAEIGMGRRQISSNSVWSETKSGPLRFLRRALLRASSSRAPVRRLSRMAASICSGHPFGSGCGLASLGTVVDTLGLFAGEVRKGRAMQVACFLLSSSWFGRGRVRERLRALRGRPATRCRSGNHSKPMSRAGPDVRCESSDRRAVPGPAIRARSTPRPRRDED